MFKKALFWILYSGIILPLLALILLFVEELIFSLWRGFSVDVAFYKGGMLFIVASLMFIKIIPAWVVPTILLWLFILSFFPVLEFNWPIFLIGICGIYATFVFLTQEALFGTEAFYVEISLWFLGFLIVPRLPSSSWPKVLIGILVIYILSLILIQKATSNIYTLSFYDISTLSLKLLFGFAICLIIPRRLSEKMELGKLNPYPKTGNH